MPIEIVESHSNPKVGEINVDDVKKIINDFDDLVGFTSKSVSRPIQKTEFVTIPRSILQALLEKDTEFDYVNIHFGVTLPDAKSCGDDFQTDISNQLTVLINRAKFDDQGNMTEATCPGDYVCTPGFKSNTKSMAPVCCGEISTGGR